MSWIYLSHVLSNNTPLYGGNGQVKIERSRTINSGDSSNSSEISLPAHAGTHVDAPYHFDPDGTTLDGYMAEYWFNTKIWLIDVDSKPGEILNLSKIGPKLEMVPENCDLLLLRTGAESWRADNPKLYEKEGPGVGVDVALWLRKNRKLKFLGMDFISTSSFAHRELGREAHRAFLGADMNIAPPIMLVEDMALSKLEHKPNSVWIVPIRFSEADGAPVTVMAQI